MGLIHAAILAALVLAGALARWLWQRPTRNWQAGPRIGFKNYSSGIAVKQDGEGGSFDWDASIHYLTRSARRIGPELRIVYEIEAEPGTEFLESETLGDRPLITAHFQRKGDDWKASDKTKFYRWWAPVRVPVTPGRHDVRIAVDGRWTHVYGQTDPDRMADALANIERVGLCFGGPSGAGHGVHCAGEARFRLIAFEGVD